MVRNTLNAVGQISFANLADYQHNMLQGLVDSVNYYSLGDSRRCLPIRYLKQQESNNDDTETGLKHKQFNSTYFEYHLVPVLENEMLNPMITMDETKQGMNSTSTGELVILTIDKPLVNDLFDFYIDSHNGMGEQKEMFRIIEVNFLRTSANLNIYRLTYETSNVIPSQIFIEESFFWFNDFRRFYPTKYVEFMKKIIQKDYLLILRKYYKPEWSILYDETLSKEVNVKINKLILYIKYKDYTNSAELPLILINGFDPSLITDPLMEDDDTDTINFTKEDVWYPDLTYVHKDPTQPGYEYKWTNGKLPNELAFCAWQLIHYYKPFISDMSELDKNNLNGNLFNQTNINDSAKSLKSDDNKNMLTLSDFRNVTTAIESYKIKEEEL